MAEPEVIELEAAKVEVPVAEPEVIEQEGAQVEVPVTEVGLGNRGAEPSSV